MIDSVRASTKKRENNENKNLCPVPFAKFDFIFMDQFVSNSFCAMVFPIFVLFRSH